MIPTPRAKDAFVDSNSSHVNYWLDNFYGNVEGGVFDVTEDLKRLPENKCKFVMLCNWNAADDTALTYTALSGDSLYENNGDEIYYGFAGVLVAQLFPSQNSGLLPLNNTNQICVRTRPGNTLKLWYACFW